MTWGQSCQGKVDMASAPGIAAFATEVQGQIEAGDILMNNVGRGKSLSDDR